MDCKNCWMGFGSGIVTYKTPKILRFKSKPIAIINLTIQFAIVGYFFGYVLYYKKGFQSTDTVKSVVTAKVKGVVFTNSTLPGIGNRIWDAVDYVEPPHEANAFFVMTNMVVTPNQTRSICPEDPTKKDVRCTVDSDCPAGTRVFKGNGMRTGRCVPSDQGNGTVCEIHAWCPVERDYTQKPALLRDSADFTVLIKNNIEFNKFNFMRRNIMPEWMDKDYVSTCLWNKHTDPLCPVFRLGDIVSEAGESYDEMAHEGGVMAIEIKWNYCNLDRQTSRDKCKPKYSFRRLDKPNSNIAPGWNFRFSSAYMDNGVQTRTLTKAYGILFNILVTGTAGKADFLTCMLKTGSSFALLGLAPIACEFILGRLCCIQSQRKLFNKEKYSDVNACDTCTSCERRTEGDKYAEANKDGNQV